MTAATEILTSRFGYPEFRPGQEQVVESLLAGRSALAVFPTGGGKSLCYQIPSLIRPGLGLVVSPLIALMTDQVAAMQQSGVAAARQNNGNPDPVTGALLGVSGSGCAQVTARVTCTPWRELCAWRMWN